MSTCAYIYPPSGLSGPGYVCGRPAAHIVEVNDPLTGRATLEVCDRCYWLMERRKVVVRASRMRGVE